MEALTREEVRELIFSASTHEEALRALEAGKRWLQEHPDDLVLGMELSMVDRLASSFMPSLELEVSWSTVGRPPPQESWTMYVDKADSKRTEQGDVQTTP